MILISSLTWKDNPTEHVYEWLEAAYEDDIINLLDITKEIQKNAEKIELFFDEKEVLKGYLYLKYTEGCGFLRGILNDFFSVVDWKEIAKRFLEIKKNPEE